MDLVVRGANSIGIELDSYQIQLFERYYSFLRERNSSVNLTSKNALELTEIRHFLDSLQVSLALSHDMLHSGSFVDIGSGAGFPGLPMKIAFPDLRPTLIESVGKKTRFLEELVVKLDLDNVSVVTARAEIMAHRDDHREKFDFAVARAVANISTLVELTLPFCRIGGLVIIPKGPHIQRELDDGMNAISELGGKVQNVISTNIYEFGHRPSNLLVIEKIHGTSDRYPRRAGLPAKRPL